MEKDCSKFSRSKQGRSSAGNCLRCVPAAVVGHPGKKQLKGARPAIGSQARFRPSRLNSPGAGAAAPRTSTVNTWRAVNACCWVAAQFRPPLSTVRNS